LRVDKFIFQLKIFGERRFFEFFTQILKAFGPCLFVIPVFVKDRMGDGNDVVKADDAVFDPVFPEERIEIRGAGTVLPPTGRGIDIIAAVPSRGRMVNAADAGIGCAAVEISVIGKAVADAPAAPAPDEGAGGQCVVRGRKGSHREKQRQQKDCN